MIRKLTDRGVAGAGWPRDAADAVPRQQPTCIDRVGGAPRSHQIGGGNSATHRFYECRVGAQEMIGVAIATSPGCNGANIGGELFDVSDPTVGNGIVTDRLFSPYREAW